MAATAVIAETPEANALEWRDLAPLTVEQYYRMLETGILQSGEPVELLDGCLVRKDRGNGVTISPRHSFVVAALTELVAKIQARGFHLRMQNPIAIPAIHVPEPDGAVVRGSRSDYRDRHPQPEEVSSVIEVAQTSLERDRRAKLRIYAGAGIPQYLIVNVLTREVEIYEQPSPESRGYLARSLARPGEPVPLLLPDGSRLEVDAAEWVG